ncbi:MAG: aminopeptidase [Gammaproteobacteria bacterium]|nr:aminopeptidase [Gammaproteobacteria bacterium]
MAVFEATAVKLTLALFVLATASGCSTLAYYGQAIAGHVEVMHARRPLQQVIDDPTTVKTVREKLVLASKARQFAVRELGLPDNGSYSTYADLGRRFVVWNVVATPEFSFSPKQWCYPFTGCLAYRGFYRRADAKAQAERLRAAGFDVTTGGVRAYSTLGWFSDPVLSTMLEPARPYLAGVIFHELTHEHIYVQGDSKFNESLATFVEHEGTQRWLVEQADDVLRQRHHGRLKRRQQFLLLVERYQQRLRRLYRSPVSQQQMRLDKTQLFAAMRDDYHRLSSHWSEPGAYARFFDEDLNNARLASVATYFEWLPAFARLFDEVGGNFPRFYERCAALAKMSMEERHRRMNALAGGTTL